MNQNRFDIDEHLLLQYLLGNTDEESGATIETWLNADSRNKKHLDQLESLWLETGKLSPAPVAVDIDTAWLTMAKRIEEHENVKNGFQSRSRSIRMSPVRYLLGIAALILLLIGIYGLYRMIGNPEYKIEVASGSNIVHDTLPDGSKVTLNRNSKLIFSEGFDKGNREVKLTGEAFFEVSHDAKHPFTVDAGLARVLVLGTTFSVRTYPVEGSDRVNLVEVVVTEGRVMLFRIDERSGDTAKLILMAGESGSMKEGDRKPIRNEAAPPDGNFWANQSLDFRSTQLSAVFELIERYYSVHITVSDPAILNCRLTASFVNEPPESILAVITES
ncbi:MAG: FecR domain-containing protein, partial [Bacteroidetes bacterium]|nr:FecR domain-containing protein [Bacteroidota bacterium]